MKTITYGPKPPPKPQKSFVESLADDMERHYSIKLLSDVIEELQRRRARLEFCQEEIPPAESASQEIHPETNFQNLGKSTIPKRRGRKPGFKQPWSEARRDAHKAKQARKLEDIRNNPRLAALTQALTGMVGVKQDGESQKPKVMIADGQ
jgi:hypothetical protein